MRVRAKSSGFLKVSGVVSAVSRSSLEGPSHFGSARNMLRQSHVLWGNIWFSCSKWLVPAVLLLFDLAYRVRVLGG